MICFDQVDEYVFTKAGEAATRHDNAIEGANKPTTALPEYSNVVQRSLKAVKPSTRAMERPSCKNVFKKEIKESKEGRQKG